MSTPARIIAVANQKGGVAKTTTTINLGASLAMANQRVLLVDLDPQGNLTSGVGQKDVRGEAGTAYEALTVDDLDPRAVVVPTGVDHLSLIPADRDLTGAEIELVTFLARERRLARLLDTLRADFDFIFVDSPPSLGLLTLNALVAADSVLIPLNCEYFALEGIAELTATIERVRQSLNANLAIEGVLLTMYDDRTNLGQQVSANIREFFGAQVYETVIPRNIRLGEAPSHGVPVILYDARSRGAEAYVALAHEFMARRQGSVADAAAKPDAATQPPAPPEEDASSDTTSAPPEDGATARPAADQVTQESPGTADPHAEPRGDDTRDS